MRITVGELRKRLQGHPSDMPVEMELVIEEFPCGDMAVGDVQAASAETRCDGVPRFYLWGIHGKVREPQPELELVP